MQNVVMSLAVVGIKLGIEVFVVQKERQSVLMMGNVSVCRKDILRLVV